MDDEPKKRINREICVAMLLLRKYINIDCSDGNCPYNQLLLAVLEQEEADRRERQEAEALRQQEMMAKKQMEDD